MLISRKSRRVVTWAIVVIVAVALVIVVSLALRPTRASAPLVTWTPAYYGEYGGSPSSWTPCNGYSDLGSLSTSTSTGEIQDYGFVDSVYSGACSLNTAQTETGAGFWPTSGWEYTAATGDHTLAADWTLTLAANVQALSCWGTAYVQVQANIGLWDQTTDSNVVAVNSAYWVNLQASSLPCQSNNAPQYGGLDMQIGTVILTGELEVVSTTFEFIQDHSYQPRSAIWVTGFTNCGHAVCPGGLYDSDTAQIDYGVNDYPGLTGPSYTATLDSMSVT